MSRKGSDLSSERVYITLLGRSVWALLNTYYAITREAQYFPDTVYIAVEAPFRDQAVLAEEGVLIISRAMGFSPEIESIDVDQADIVDAFRKLHTRISGKKKAGAKVAIDITPGRKATVAGILLPIKLDDVDHVFYLEISTTVDVAKPFQMIPRQFHRLHDFKAQAVRARDGC